MKNIIKHGEMLEEDVIVCLIIGGNGRELQLQKCRGDWTDR